MNFNVQITLKSQFVVSIRKINSVHLLTLRQFPFSLFLLRVFSFRFASLSTSFARLLLFSLPFPLFFSRVVSPSFASVFPPLRSLLFRTTKLAGAPKESQFIVASGAGNGDANFSSLAPLRDPRDLRILLSDRSLMARNVACSHQ